MKFLLASTSPRRKELFKQLVTDFEIASPHFDERSVKINNPKKLVQTLAVGKAKAVFDLAQGDWCVVGADTMVVLGKELIRKKKDLEDAVNMIKKFSGNTHKVITGVCIMIRQGDIETSYSFSVTSKLYFNKLTEQEIKNYVENNNVLDKAGGYAIQEGAGKFIKKIEGSFHNIVGLPIAEVYEILLKENLL